VGVDCLCDHVAGRLFVQPMPDGVVAQKGLIGQPGKLEI
jgi:hypothetical protein